METRRSLGEDCLKNDDCLSGVCSQLRCAASPAIIDAQVTRANDEADAPANATADAMSDAPTDTSDGAGMGDVAVETASGPPAQSPQDSAVDDGTSD